MLRRFIWRKDEYSEFKEVVLGDDEAQFIMLIKLWWENSGKDVINKHYGVDAVKENGDLVLNDVDEFLSEKNEEDSEEGKTIAKDLYIDEVEEERKNKAQQIFLDAEDEEEEKNDDDDDLDVLKEFFDDKDDGDLDDF